MELEPRAYEKIIQLITKGVTIPNPLTLDIGDEVDIDRISGRGVTIYPGCRIYGDKTVISSGVRIGAEGPVTIDNCQLGGGVELKGGYFAKSVFLEKANMGLGAHVREGCVLEEEANGAHCVGLKQTILFPFVTLGSLINFCDCLMAGGTSRKDHSEVGSSYIHFNFTPDGDKTTPSLIGDVPRGVMLNQPLIFLGGQGGMVGPLRIGYGNVVAAGSILRHDVSEGNKMIIGKTHQGLVIDVTPRSYKNILHVVENNIRYLANLVALEQWYVQVRRLFFCSQDFGDLLYEGLLDTLSVAKKERTKRLAAMADKMPDSLERYTTQGQAAAGKRELHEKIEEVCALFLGPLGGEAGIELRDRFLAAFLNHKEKQHKGYIEVIQSLPDDISRQGVRWLTQIVDTLCEKGAALVPNLGLFKE
ncbi:MAG: UDP-N-acetylglucosamine pyrophosphorylase [Deltaproteobacteria bacterium]|nr:UDP-N-acetylglucosamine pyrophosphorylase [Deltaproteobacteria bacterium]